MSDSGNEQILNQIIQGKRHLLIKDFYSAVQSFEKVCQLLDEKFGKGSNECGDAYLNYGISLLELARQETGASDGLVNAKVNDPSGSEGEDEDDDDDDDDDDDYDDDDDDDYDENEDNQDSEDKGNEENKDQQNSDENGKKSDSEEDLCQSESEKDIDDKVTINQAADVSSSLNEPSTSSGIKNKTEDEDDDEATNIEVAWEVLTTARDIFERQIQNGQNVQLKLSEALQKLGEIAIEWENNEYAIEVLNQCLSIRRSCLPEDDRLLAETYYHIGNANSFISQVEKANDCFHRAIDVILKRIENKKKLIEETEDKDAASLADLEIKELENLLPEMRARIEDKQDQMTNAKQALLIEASEKKLDEEVAAKIKKIEDKPVNNVSHLVKRKQMSPGNETNSKKICTNNESSQFQKNSSI